MELQEILLCIFEEKDRGQIEKGIEGRRAKFMNCFGRAWANEIGAESNTIFPVGRTDEYFSSILRGNKPIRPVYTDMHDLKNEASFSAWMSEYLDRQQWDRLRRKLYDKGVEVVTYHDLYLVLAQLVDDGYAQMSNGVGTGGKKRKLHTAPAGVNLNVDVVEADEEELELGTEGITDASPKSMLSTVSGESIESASGVPTLKFIVQIGWKNVEFSNMKAALSMYCIAERDESARPSLYITTSDAIITPIYLHKTPDGRHHLVLPKSVPAELLRCPDVFSLTATICREMDVIVDNVKGDCNTLFIQRTAQIPIGPDGYPVTDQTCLRLYDDNCTTLSFAVRHHLFASLIYYDAYDDAYSAWNDMPWYAALYLVWSNADAGLHYRLPIGVLRHINYWDVMTNSVLMLSQQVCDFLASHSSGRRTFWGIE